MEDGSVVQITSQAAGLEVVSVNSASVKKCLNSFSPTNPFKTEFNLHYT